jgi:DNA-binding protein H-NS
MTYDAKVTLKFDSTWSSTTGGIYDAEILPEQHITFEAPAEDLNATQLFQLFSKFMFSLGYTEKSIASGACYLAFNDMRSFEDMKKVADEYDLFLAEDYHKKLVEYDAQQDEEIKKLEAEIRELKSKLADILPEQYEQPSITKQVLENAYTVCKDCGKKYGEYSVGCSSVWEGECDVCGETKPVTEKRDYGYLEKGIKELSK